MKYGRKNLFYIYICIILSILLLSILYASIFTYYPIQVSFQPVSPPIVLRDPSQPGVTVSTGSAGASATVSYLIPYTVSISQGVIYYSTFDTGLPSGWNTYGAGRWASSPGWASQGVSGSTSGGQAQTDVAYYASDLYSSQYNGYIYLAAYISTSNINSGRWAGIAFHGTATENFYACTIGNGGRLEIILRISFISEFWTALSSVTASILSNKFYLLVCARNPSTGVIIAQLYDPSTGSLVASTSATDTTIGPTSIGLVVRRTAGGGSGVSAVFDELVLAYRDPRFVCITNVPSGWGVEIYNGSTLIGSQISSGSAAEVCLQIYGPSSPQGSYSTILRQGVIRVYDSSNILRASLGPQVIVGGSLYRLDPQASTTRILNVLNLDGKSYYALLTLINYSSSGFSSIQIRVCGSTCSSWISIPPPPSQTTEIQIPSGTGYIELSQTPTMSGAQASISLFLNYSTLPGQQGASVAYPISISLK